MNNLIGKKAYKKTGFYSGAVGTIEKSTSSITPYKITFYHDGKSHGSVGFRTEKDIVLLDEGEINENP